MMKKLVVIMTSFIAFSQVSTGAISTIAVSVENNKRALPNVNVHIIGCGDYTQKTNSSGVAVFQAISTSGTCTAQVTYNGETKRSRVYSTGATIRFGDSCSSLPGNEPMNQKKLSFAMIPLFLLMAFGLFVVRRRSLTKE